MKYKTFRLFCSLFCVSFIFVACPKDNVRPAEELLELANSEEGYTINSGDTLMVNVWGEPRLSGEVFVREDGKFTLPLVEEIDAEGKTLGELTNDITKRLKEFIPAASVTVSVVQTAPIRYFLMGQFTKPGEFRSDKKITFLQAIATGGGFAPFADESNVILIRKNATGEFRYELDYNRVVEGAEPNPELKNGDIIAIK